MATRPLSTKDDLAVEKTITAMIVCESDEQAVEMLAEQGVRTSVAQLDVIRNGGIATRQRFEERRDELAPALEAIFANDLLDNARRASLITSIALDKTRELLERGKVEDPARVARDLSQVMSQSVEKRLAVQGRPTQIVEHRDVGEIVRALEAMKVIQVVDSTAIEVTSDADAR